MTFSRRDALKLGVGVGALPWIAAVFGVRMIRSDGGR